MLAVLLWTLFFSPSEAALAPQAIVLVGPTRILLPHTAGNPELGLEVLRDPRFKGRPEPVEDSHFLLRIFSVGSTADTVAETPFYTSYGTFQLDVVPLSGSEPGEFVLITGDGNGTNVRREIMTVYRLTDLAFEPILVVPVSGFFGFGRWWYERHYDDVNADRKPDIRLILRHDPISASDTNDPKAVPAAETLEYVWDLQTRCMQLFRQQDK